MNNYIFKKYWAKVDREDQERYHLFHFHCMDVIAVADVWLDKSAVILKQLAQQSKLSCAKTKQIVLFYIALHDLGKLDARFQRFVEQVRIKLQVEGFTVDSEAYNHGDYGYQHFLHDFELEKSAVMKDVAAHHGFCNTSFEYFDPDADPELIEQDKIARQQWVDFCLSRFGLKSIPDIKSSMSLLAGLCSVSDWIGSSLTNFSTDPEYDIDSYYAGAKIRAETALEETGMLPSTGNHGFDKLFNKYQPKGIQTLISKLPVEPGITVVESDTGSGKTEFAIAYASELIHAGFADGIVFALPTQATANGLFERIGSVAEKLFPDGQITLAHGKKKYFIPDNDGFLHFSNKRAFLASVSVATIDQILMGVLPVKHNFVRTFGIQKSVLIIDEVHCFDAYMLGLLESVIKGQQKSFASVILLSATLTLNNRKKLLNMYGASSIKLSENYPIVSWLGLNGTAKTYSLDKIKKTEYKIINSQVWQSELLLVNESQQKKIISWAQSGAMVCIICNTVIDAQETYNSLKNNQSCKIEIDLFHARYTNKDRIKLENNVLKNYGKTAKRKGRILVATQVVEQSLDLDFDVMISQIAPVEFIFQRMGRLWRHNRSETSDLSPRSKVFDSPTFISLCPQLNNTANLLTAYKATAYIYKNITALFRTQKLLQSTDILEFPTCYRPSMEYVHKEQVFDNEPPELSALAQEFNNECEASYYLAKKISNIFGHPVSDTDSSAECLTREGEMSIRVVLTNSDRNLIHGGQIENELDRELSTVQLSKKMLKGIWNEKYHIFTARIGKDLIYNDLGVSKMNEEN